MSEFEKEIVCLPLRGAQNVRDLGGYRTAGGGRTKQNVFVRAAKLDELTDQDKNFLYRYGVRTVVDLRSAVEVQESPCGLLSYDDIRYANVPLIDNIHSDNLNGRYPASMSEMYIGLLKNSAVLIKQALIRLKEEKQCALFNCTAGKDRTGVMAMLLLNLAGVDRDTIIEDYSASERYNTQIKEVQQEVLNQFGVLLPDYLFESKPEQMERTLRFLESEYRDAASYMEKIGMTAKEIEALGEKFTE